MSENKKYYYLKFKENYFEQDHIKVIEAMKNGYEYSLIILKLYLKCLKWDGQLRITEAIPYTADKIDLLAGVLGHDPANVMHAVNLAKDLGVIDIISTGEMFMSDIQNFIGKSSTEGDRKRAYRHRIQGEETKKLPEGQMSDKRPPELELELELELDIEKDIEKAASPSAGYNKTFDDAYKKIFGVDQKYVNRVIYGDGKEIMQLNNLKKKLDGIDEFKQFLECASKDNFIRNSFVPSMLNSQFSKIMSRMKQPQTTPNRSNGMPPGHDYTDELNSFSLDEMGKCYEKK